MSTKEFLALIIFVVAFVSILVGAILLDDYLTRSMCIIDNVWVCPKSC